MNAWDPCRPERWDVSNTWWIKEDHRDACWFQEVTSPPDCPGDSLYIPEGFKTDNTLPEWEDEGAAWKEWDRCDAWWGGLGGSPNGEPVVLDAPLDWPDCCALCSGGGDDDGANTETTCAAWSFDPSTGSCQRMSAVESTSQNNTWGAWQYKGTVKGYPGYFEAPINDCWSRMKYDLCVNPSMGLIVPGMFVAFWSILCMYFPVGCQKLAQKSGKGGIKYFYTYKGTFAACDGALFVLPPPTRLSNAPRSSHKIEKRMLRVLYNTNLNPRADPGVASRAGDSCDKRKRQISNPIVPHDARVLLVGILGEDRITCIDHELLGSSSCCRSCASFCLVLAAVMLVTMCVALLTNEAAQHMAEWTFEGDYRIGAVVGLMLRSCVPLSFAWNYRNSNKLFRLVKDCPVAESDRVVHSRT
ncbi:unnamed protein product [Ectocarpus sp. CCAP 1310/34]|nr:unnamed protein product [Ectocarpus sp. CCAP 1310/34]